MSFVFDVMMSDVAHFYFSLMCLATTVIACRWFVEEKTNPEMLLMMSCLAILECLLNEYM